MAIEITDGNFEEMVVNTEKVSVLDFWAEWCGPCKVISPIIEELSQEYGSQAVIGKVNVDYNSGVAIKYGIRNIPTVLFLKAGEVVDKQVGAVPKTVLENKLKALI